MAEGRNPTLGCGFGCVGARCGWVPPPRLVFPRRDPLIDAVGRTDNPCDRPARCPPCCKPTPKFRLPREKPECDINCYRQEQAEAKIQEYWEQRQKYLDRYCPCPPPQCEIEILDPCKYPVAVEMPEDESPENVWRLKDQPCRTNIIAGFFNPNDNVPIEEMRRRRCDPFFKSCGPDGLAPYPCRGVINSPRQAWVSLAQEQRLCVPEDCEGSPYLDPDYLAQQQQIRDQMEQEKRLERDQKSMLTRSNQHPCCPEKFSQSPYCLCNKNFC
ncbi:uncharacterized protein LOC110859384 [Folsomia candida]|uniref:Uncharacterized protein n=1 Tax=Folsomia candida TaxID=158441 RepID=A0A226DAW7_FOLCA|nr:uncharacterized protein LOC110859384 [Folsomia candida]OXA42695.1 hypothetical protein Fcan01_22584 [Folsomia candida]